MILDAAGRFAHEIADRAGLADAIRVIPAFGERFALVRPWSIFESDKRPPGPATTMALLPRSCQLRLGSIPVIAHAIMHELVQQKGPPLIEEFLAESGELAGIDDLVQNLSSSWAGIKNAGKVQEVWARAEELVCDLFACTVCGPAYFYSMVRFVSGTLSDFVRPSKSAGTRLPFSKRCATCFRVLRGLGFEMSFHSDYFRTDVVPAPDSFCRWLNDKVSRPYMAHENTALLDACERELSEGKPSNADPVTLLNAVWRAVVRKGPYLNEIALLLSLID
jgi:hypothetical protein